MENNNEITVPEIHKEIDLVQDCIKRMAQNSFMIKGWAFASIAALIALANIKHSIDITVLCSVGFVLLISLWCLDAFFLKTEKLYRFKYEWIIINRKKSGRDTLYNLNPYEQKMWNSIKIWVEPSFNIDLKSISMDECIRISKELIKKDKTYKKDLRKKNPNEISELETKYKVIEINRIEPSVLEVMISKPYTLLLLYCSPIAFCLFTIIYMLVPSLK